MRQRDGSGFGARIGQVLAVVGILALVAATVSRPGDTREAASQDWSPFVLVTGLLLIGLVADDDGLFATVGHYLARTGTSCSLAQPS
jgi:Na+/H+ antiporter NhaD/arsenite permease-like protein